MLQQPYPPLQHPAHVPRARRRGERPFPLPIPACVIPQRPWLHGYLVLGPSTAFVVDVREQLGDGGVRGVAHGRVLEQHAQHRDGARPAGAHTDKQTIAFITHFIVFAS
jgi:hypothetical protein